MTRENKLALVVGFALILVVGILISDHFSAARSQKSAQLGQVVDPTQNGSLASSDLIEYDNGVSAPLTNPSTVGAQPSGESFIRNGLNAAMNYGQDFVRGTQAPRDATALAANNQSQRSPNMEPPGQGSNSGLIDPLMAQNNRSSGASSIPGFYHVEHEGQPINIAYHHVSPGESLTAISRKYYGNDSMVKQLAALNDITDPNEIKEGMRLRIPANAPQLVASSHTQRLQAATADRPTTNTNTQTPPVQQPATTPANVKTYTVKAGDTLGEIALKTMGTSRKWQKLYEYNKDVLKDPNHVESGTVLKIPPA